MEQEHYLVVKNVTLQVGTKEYRKDKILSAEELGPDNIARFMRKGYIKLLGGESPVPAAAPRNEELPFYLTAEDYLPPEQVNRLLKTQLVEYAGHIGYADFKSNISAADLKKQINQFIEEARLNEESEDDTADESEDEDGTEE